MTGEAPGGVSQTATATKPVWAATQEIRFALVLYGGVGADRVAVDDLVVVPAAAQRFESANDLVAIKAVIGRLIPGVALARADQLEVHASEWQPEPVPRALTLARQPREN